ncbi:hypothetical protein PISMIDRAFT_19172 [Pisolithus microcarpus 441]|uniref:Uncharacterized protein n=1 Tax=Pisolithus microcarpus 441 TaxID=765257 RepID=A0A0C9XHR3_9AGAM|nr:hypothetical protein PISMIDRAFT_19172 [Pisolithus microcarpus 441]
MSTTKATTLTKTLTKPRYLSPDASRELIPKMWATNMEKLRSLMKEVPDEAVAEDVVWGWMDEYYEVSSKPKPVPGGASGLQAGGETTRWSQWQLEKATARGNEGDKDLPTSGGSASIKAAATGPEESAAQGLGGGMEAPTLTPPKGTLKVHPQVISRAIPATGAATSLPNLNLPLTAPSISQPPPPLFLPSSPMNTPVPSTSWTEVEPQDDPTTFATSLSSLLDKAPSGEFEADQSGDEGNPETPQLSVQGEDDIGSHPHGSAEVWWTLFGGTPHAVAQYNMCLAAAIGTVEWAKSIMAELHSGMG